MQYQSDMHPWFLIIQVTGITLSDKGEKLKQKNANQNNPNI